MTPKSRSQQSQKPMAILHSICSHLEEAVFLIDGAGKIREANDAAVTRLGMPISELVGGFLAELAADKDSVGETISEVRKSKQPVYAKIDLVDSEGRTVNLVACIQKVPTMRDLLILIAKPLPAQTEETNLAGKIFDLEQKLVKLQVSLSNMGARLSEKTIQLAEERNKSMAVITHMADGLVVLDEEKRITQINPKTREILNVAGDEILGKSFEEILPTLARFMDGIEGDYAGEKNRLKGGVKCSIDGKTVQALSTSLTDGDGNVNGEIIVLRDITREEEFARMREELISIVSHEIRSPLTMITGYMTLVLRGEAGEVPKAQREFLEIAAKNGERLTKLINDLLDLSRLTSGLTTLNLSKLDAVYLVNMAYYNFQKAAVEKDIVLIKEVPEEPVYVSGDDNRLVQVMTNLVANAIKYTPNGGKIVVWLRNAEDGVVLGVTDTGMGIAPEECGKVFEKFFRSKDVAKRKIGGTGLGLPISKAIIQAHQSNILVESVVGQGSTFSFRLPRWEETEKG